MKLSVAKATGIVLLVLSGLAVLQTGREMVLWTIGERSFEERDPEDRTFTFAGRHLSIADDQPVYSGYSEIPTDGQIQASLDGRALGPPSRAGVRRHRNDLGRYHGWYDAWIFHSKSANDSALFLVRRLQPRPQDTPLFEITVIDAAGASSRRILHGWQLAWDYRVFRSTQFVREGTWTVMPLTLTGIIGAFPLFILFPIGTALIGVVLIRRGRRLNS